MKKQNYMHESVLDSPKRGLDPAVWTKNPETNTYDLTGEASARTAKLLKWVISNYDVPDIRVFIIGSITSNQYSTNSDIDLNICTSAATTKEQAADLCRVIKKDFTDKYMKQYPEDSFVGTHPFEIYIQYNPYRCLASAGCYDYVN